MKKIVYSLMLAAGLFTSCSEYLDVNTDPNKPSDVSVDLILPAAQTHLATTMTGYLSTYAGIFAQYYEQGLGANSYNNLTIYAFGVTQFDDVYTDTYAETLSDLEQIRIKSKASEDWGNYYAATVLRCYAFQVMADLFGKAPYTEALQGVANTTPKWDDAKVIYNGLLKELDDAEAMMDDPADYNIGSGFFLVGDASGWVKFANALRLKLLMRSSYAQDNSAAIKALITEDNFPTKSVEFEGFEASDNKRNPFYEMYDSSTGLIAAYPIASVYLAEKDPRILAMFEYSEDKPENDIIFGMIPGSKTYAGRNQSQYNDDQAKESYMNLKYNDYLETETRPVSMISLAEINFFKAEAYLRFFGDDAAAKAAYEAGVDASFSIFSGLPNDADMVYGAGGYDDWSAASTEEEKLEVIGRQKWVSLCQVNNFEAWCEIRRMGYPKMTDIPSDKFVFFEGETKLGYHSGDMIEPVMNYLTNNNYVRRAYYPMASSKLNKNTPANNTGISLGEPVWWDAERL